MISGRPWMARMKPSEPGLPGSIAKAPNRNFWPCVAASSNRVTTPLNQRKAARLPGVQKTSAPMRSWMPTPQMMTRQFIRLRSAESSQAKAISATRPATLTRFWPYSTRNFCISREIVAKRSAVVNTPRVFSGAPRLRASFFCNDMDNGCRPAAEFSFGEQRAWEELSILCATLTSTRFGSGRGKRG